MKKTSLPLLLALLLSLLMAATPALAQQGIGRTGIEHRPSPPPRLDHIGGEIIDLDATAGTMSIQPLRGEPVTVQTSEDTQFHRQLADGGCESISFGDLATGDNVQVQGEWDGELFNATRVIVLLLPPVPLSAQVRV